VAGCVAFGATADPIDALVRISAAIPNLGYALKVRGAVRGDAGEFLIGAGQGAHAKHQFQAGAAVSGQALPVPDPRFETVEFYKVGNLKFGPPEAKEEAFATSVARCSTAAGDLP
jgi:hypothetical protein